MSDAAKPSNFIREIIEEHIRTGRFGGKVVTRFPPEPNGYLHIGHAKAICIDFGLARDYGGRCHLRFDDTNPTKESQEYVEAIMNDVRWLGFDWAEHLHHASDYFEQLYRWAEQLITAGRAYVDDQSADELRETRGTLTEGGRPSPFRDRSVEENLDLFRRMRAGEFPDGSKTLRAKIDMTSGNINLRDPVMYRIRKTPHQRTGDRWSIYPMYDWAHGQSDSIEGVTHSICTLEYEDHRPLYDWYLDALGIFHPQQIEFARLNLSHTVMSKRKLLQLVEGGFVRGWDDPRMPTLAGLRRRGYTPESIRDFCERIGVAKADNMIELALLEHCIREDLNRRAERRMAVLRPLKLVITNYPEGKVEQLDAVNNPENPSAGTRKVPFSRELWIEQDDFKEVAPKKYFRLTPGAEVRLRYAYIVKCTDFALGPDGRHRRRRQRRPHRQGHHPLGVRRPRRRGGGAPVRDPLRHAQARRRRGLQGRAEPELPERAERRPPGAGAGVGGAGLALPVRAQRLLLRGLARLGAGAPGVQPYRGAARHLGEDREGRLAYRFLTARPPLSRVAACTRRISG
jgi:glutaminyl-tRNA synthetase